MQSYIYRSEKKIDCYLFLRKQEKDFELPDVVKKVVGALHFVMEIDITPDTKLALSEPDKVLTAMEEQGFYIQMPPSKPHPVDELFERLFDEESS
ncbi:MAG: YcgL domain-containing protein [Arenicella sp.]